MLFILIIFQPLTFSPARTSLAGGESGIMMQKKQKNGKKQTVVNEKENTAPAYRGALSYTDCNV